MKVFLITKEPFPNGMAATKRITCYAKGLISVGIKCEVIVATRTEIHGQPTKNLLPSGENFRYIGDKTERASSVLIRKFFDYVDIAKTLNYLVKNSTSDDIIFNYLREDSLNGLVIKAAKRTGAKVVRDLCEYPYGTGNESDKIKRKRDYFLKNIFPKFDGFICISQPLYDLAKNYKAPNAKLIKVPILVDHDGGEYAESISPLATPYIFHSGTLYEQKDGILGAIEAFAIASQRLNFHIKYVLTGNLGKSPDRVKIEDIIIKYGIQDMIIFTGFLSVDDLKTYQKNCSLMIVNKPINLQNTYCFATKLGEYLLTGKPVITTNVGEAMVYLEDEESAYVVKPGDVQLLANKIVESFNNPVSSNRIGINGKHVAEMEFSYNKQGEKIKLFLKSL